MRGKTYIIAEIGVNHNGSLTLAKTLIQRLSLIGADAVKFQLSIPEEVYSSDSFKPEYQLKNEESVSPLEMSQKFQLHFEDHEELYNTCRDNRVDYLCSAFDIQSLQFLDKHFDLPFFKIASGEIFTLDMLEYISQRDRPILLSTGMATYKEMEISIELLNKNFKKDITLLHCVSNYPVPEEDVNLNVISELQHRFRCDVGFSDHTLGSTCAIAAVALGAVVIEKHVTADRNMSGPDHKASVGIDEFAQYVKVIRTVEKSLGGREKKFSSAELEIKKAARKSIVAKRDLVPGEIISSSDICYKRPGTGYTPLEKNAVVGQKVKCAIGSNRVIMREHLLCQ